MFARTSRISFRTPMTMIVHSAGQNVYVHGLLHEGWQTVQAFGQSSPNHLEPLPAVVSPLVCYFLVSTSTQYSLRASSAKNTIHIDDLVSRSHFSSTSGIHVSAYRDVGKEFRAQSEGGSQDLSVQERAYASSDGRSRAGKGSKVPAAHRQQPRRLPRRKSCGE